MGLLGNLAFFFLAIWFLFGLVPVLKQCADLLGSFWQIKDAIEFGRTIRDARRAAFLSIVIPAALAAGVGLGVNVASTWILSPDKGLHSQGWFVFVFSFGGVVLIGNWIANRISDPSKDPETFGLIRADLQEALANPIRSDSVARFRKQMQSAGMKLPFHSFQLLKPVVDHREDLEKTLFRFKDQKPLDMHLLWRLPDREMANVYKRARGKKPYQRNWLISITAITSGLLLLAGVYPGPEGANSQTAPLLVTAFVVAGSAFLVWWFRLRLTLVGAIRRFLVFTKQAADCSRLVDELETKSDWLTDREPGLLRSFLAKFW